MRRWLALFVLAIPMVCGWSVAKGQQITDGLKVVGYSIDDVPPTKSTTAYSQCGSGWYPQINNTWDYEENLFGECGFDSFMLHYTGFIKIPDGVESVRFGIASDDGSDVTIGGRNFGNWSDKGCSVDYSERYQFDSAAPLKLDAWMYENGGGTCFMLMWQFNADNQDWVIVPESAFTFEIPSQTTLLPATASTVVRSTFTTEPVVEQSIVPVVVAPSLPETTETTSATVPSESATTETSSSTTSTTTTFTSTTVAAATIATTSTTTPVEATTTTAAPKPTEPVFHNAEAVAQIANQIEKVDEQQAALLFDAIEETSLTPTEAAILIEAVQAAPENIRRTFEQHINIYNGTTDTYVPVGSQVTVRARRVIIAVSLVLIVPTAPVRKPNE